MTLYFALRHRGIFVSGPVRKLDKIQDDPQLIQL